MRKPDNRFWGLLLYLLLLGALMEFHWNLLLRPIPLISVLVGVLILTGCQYRRGIPIPELLGLAQWNAFFAGMMTTLLSLLSIITAQHPTLLESYHMAAKLIPLIYGSILYLLLGSLRIEPNISQESDDRLTWEEQTGLFSPQTAMPILVGKGFSPRECHVALKILEGCPNKEIAEQLYISETTVKKHIQNMFRKCGAVDRQDFQKLYIQWSRAGIPDQ